MEIISTMNEMSDNCDFFKFTNYTYQGKKSIRVMNSIAKRDKTIENRTILIYPPIKNVYVPAKLASLALIEEANRLDHGKTCAVKIIDYGCITLADNELCAVYCVLNCSEAALQLGQLYRLDIEISKYQKVRCRIKLMSDKVVNLRVKNVPPTASMTDLLNFANIFGEPKLLEQEASEGRSLSDTYVMVIKPHSNSSLLEHQYMIQKDIACSGANYRVQFFCEESTKEFCVRCLSNTHCLKKCPFTVYPYECDAHAANKDDTSETNSHSNLDEERCESYNVPCEEANMEAFIDKVRNYDSFASVSCVTCNTPVLKPDDGTGMWPGMPIWAQARFDKEFIKAHVFEVTGESKVKLMCREAMESPRASEQ